MLRRSANLHPLRAVDLRTQREREANMFEAKLTQAGLAVEQRLAELLASDRPGAIEAGRLGEAMRYATLGGGKRFRPFLVMEAAALFGLAQRDALNTAAAVECVHCYSLVHDDLPAMDDDDLRRGRATVHKAFDEATAILAGDGLLTLAFEILSRPDTHADPLVRSELVLNLARASGWEGMAGGQQLDLEAQGQSTGHAGRGAHPGPQDRGDYSLCCGSGGHSRPRERRQSPDDRELC